MSKLSIIVTICAALCFTFQSAESNSASVVDVSPLLLRPPYYSALGYARPASLSDSDYQKLLTISEQYNVKLSDLYQLYDQSCYNLPSYSPDAYINMIQQYCEVIGIERKRRGLPCGRYLSNSPTLSPYVESIINRPYYTPVLRRRDMMDTLDNLYDQGSAAASNMYNNLYNMVDYTISKPTQALKNQINDIIYGNGIQDDINAVENFASRLTESITHMI